MSDSPPSPEPAPPSVEKKNGCGRKLFIGCGTLLLLGVVVIGLSMWPFVDRRQRADRFGNHVKVGQTVVQVFAGPHEWNTLSVECATTDGKSRRVDVRARDDRYEAQPWDGGAPTSYANFDAVVKDLAAGSGPFIGRSEIGVAFKFYVQSRTYFLTLGPDGKVAKIERVSRQ